MHEIFGALSALGDPSEREAAARQVALIAGAEDLVILVHDRAAGALLPAPGFARTLRGGPSWREFIAVPDREGRRAAMVEMPLGSSRPAQAIVGHGAALVLLGGAPRQGEVANIELMLPLLAAALRAEAQVESKAAEAAQSKAAADRALLLADALENARAESAKLNAELREEHRRKDEFLAMLCHELRNPLAPLVISLEILRRPEITPAQSSRSLEIAARQVLQLSRLVDDLLDVSRVSRGRIELRRQPLSLVAAVSDAVETSRSLLESRRHSIAVRLPDEPLMVNADAVRLAQILANLLNNAAKYTDPGGRIEIEVSRDGAEAVVGVTDNGIGISSAALPHVFDLFMQAPVALSRSQGGLGIGLTLVRSLAELHGGRVSAESGGIGRGARFTLRLPMLTGLAPAEAAKQRSPPSTKVVRMLIVEDNRDAAESLADVARSMGHHVEVAYTGPAALQIATDGKFDLILLDIGLPEMDGYEVARRLRPIAEPGARIVAVTGYGTEEDKRRSREAGFDEHVVKPLMPEKLNELLRRSAATARVAIVEEPGAAQAGR